MDAFAATSWADHSYAFPPAPLISKCLGRIKKLSITVIMITPLWRTAAWWDTLQGMTREGPVQLGSTKDICRTGQGEQILRLGWQGSTWHGPHLL